jgi:multidrug efflux pump subunit AcrA (membrane-fusion protein)
MKNILKAFWNFIKGHKVWSIIILIVIVAIVWYAVSGGKKPVTTTYVTAEIGNIKEEVSVTGNVKPVADVDLAFERGGKVASLNVRVGDRVSTGQALASVSNADLVANLDQAKANLKKVRANFGDDADTVLLGFEQSKISLMNQIRDSYTKADDALRNKVYSMFSDPARYRARLIFITNSFLQEDIEEGKDDMGDTLDSWRRSLLKFSESSDLSLYYSEAKTDLNLLKVLLDKSAEAVNGLDSSTDVISQTQIDTWKSNISTARTSVNTAIDTLTTSFDQYKSADLAVKLSKNSTLGEEALIEQAQAQVASAEAELAKTIIRSPILGVVTDIPVELGEIVPANQKAISVISYGDYEVESFVPEADISKIKLGNQASTTLDAYGSDVNFAMSVIKIDPAATVIDGVPTYKITLRFVNQDERVRSGMTANIDVVTSEKNNVLTVPARAVYVKDGGRYVKVAGPDGVLVEQKVEVGLRGFDGRVEIVSGLNEGDKVSS